MMYLSSERLDAVERGEAEIEKVVVEAFEEADAKVRVVLTPEEVHSLPLHAGDLVLLFSAGRAPVAAGEAVSGSGQWSGRSGQYHGGALLMMDHGTS
jgi:hypothetical protein